MVKSALITGASAGIGRVYALELAARGFKELALVARRMDRLQALATELKSVGFSGRIETITCDLRSVDEREKLFKTTSELGLKFDLLINNAGFGYVGSFDSDAIENQMDMVTTNCIAPLHLTKLYLTDLKASGNGGIINVASVAAFPPLPFMTTYGATKAFLLNWSVGVREELKGTGIKVLALCPGPTESEFHLVAGVKEKVAVVPTMKAEAVVKESLEALQNDRAVLVTGFGNKVITFATRFFSKALLAKAGRRMLSDRVPPERR